MRKRERLLVPAIIGPMLLGSLLQGKEPVDYVDPMIGATTERMAQGNKGKTFPGPVMPFGMVQLGPDTITGGDHTSGYSYTHDTIEGFSFTHMSGVGWYGDFGNLLVTPTTGKLKVVPGNPRLPHTGYRSRFSHDSEELSAGYYAVTLADYDIRAELTATQRTGILRFTFPEAGNESYRVQLDLARRIGGTSTRQYIEVVNDNTIQGWMKCPVEGGGWGHGAGKVNYTLYFYAQFSQPWQHCGVWVADLTGVDRRDSFRARNMSEYRARVAETAKVIPNCREMEGDHVGFYCEYAGSPVNQVLFKAGISFVSMDGAKKNLQAELDHWDFDRVHSQARASWSRAFEQSGITIEGATEDQKEIFYTALYHTMIDPRCVSDVDGKYIGADNQVHTTSDFTYRSIFSGWDVFRSQFPLQTLINPEMVNDEINSLIQIAELSSKGYFPEWEHMNAYSNVMLGDSALSVVADAYLKGIRDYDIEQAYRICRKTALDGWRPQAEFYNQHGYVPERLSWTLESAYFDWCVARLAEALGKTEDAELFFQKALNYRNVYDPAVGNMRAKQEDRSWTEWKGNTTYGQGCVESNPYQQGWFVPHDVQGLMDLMGNDYFVSYLKEFFEKTPKDLAHRNPYFNHENEIVHNVTYLFTYAGRPWLTQKWTRFAVDNGYGTGVAGLRGNDDVGQMSAWYVLSAMGFHPVAPGDNVYILGSPIFDKVTLNLDSRYYNGKQFTLITRNNSKENLYIQSALLNGKPLERAWITHDEVTSGGQLELIMGPTPNRAWGSAPEHRPPSLSRPRKE